MEVSRNKPDFKLNGLQVGKLVRRSHAGLLRLLISMMGKPEKGLVVLNSLFTGFYPPPAPRDTTWRPLQHAYQGTPDHIHPGQEQIYHTMGVWFSTRNHIPW